MLDIDLFENISENDILELLKCIGIKTKVYRKNSVILKQNGFIDSVGIILEGKAKALSKNTDGSFKFVDEYKINDIFGHDIVCCDIRKSPVEIMTESGCEVLFIPFDKVITPCEKLCPAHLRLIRNVMKMIAKKNSVLNDKIDILALKTTGQKILAFLNKYDNGTGAFTVPYSREETARLLCVDRCALSRELSKLRDEGILRYKKNVFEFLKKK